MCGNFTPLDLVSDHVCTKYLSDFPILYYFHVANCAYQMKLVAPHVGYCHCDSVFDNMGKG